MPSVKITNTCFCGLSDVLWGRDVDKLVIPRVLETLRMYAKPGHLRK